MSPKPIKALLVEDNPGDARLIREMLIDADPAVELVLVERLSEAEERLGEERFDVVLLDITLPDSPGPETVAKIHRWASDIPIIVLTGLDDDALGVKAIEEGAQNYLVKGQVDANFLVLSMRYAIERHRIRAEVLQEERREGAGKVLGFLGAKGGVGTTTVALNVAAALAQQQKRVIALELRSHQGAFSRHISKAPMGKLRNLLELDPEQIDERDLADHLNNTPFGFQVLCRPHTGDAFKEIEPAHADPVIRGLARMAEYTVVDLPSHPARASQVALSLCDTLALVVEPEPLCLELGKAALELVSSWGLSARHVGVVVVSRTPFPSPVSLDAIKSGLGCEIIGAVPLAVESFLAAHESGTLVVLSDPTSPPATNLTAIAERLRADVLIPMRL